MAQRFRAGVSGLGVFAPVAFAVALFCCPARSALAVPCAVVHHPPLSDADKALLVADYTKAESLYRSALAANQGDADLTVALVHALLRDQKVQEAADTVKAALDAAPKSAALITLRGEVELRQGEPWTAAQTAYESLKLDPCSPRTQLLIADLARINSLYATARQALLAAHQLDPDDPEIRGEWLFTLPRKQRIAELEAYLAAPEGDDADELRGLHQTLDHLKRLEAEPPKPCRLVSQTDTAEIPFVPLIRDGTHILGFGLDVKLNDHSAHLQIDTGAGGLLISRSVANHAGLKAFSQNEVAGIGDEGLRAGDTAYAESIRIGNLEFQNCQVQVMDKGNLPGDVDGLIGMDVFSRFLVTLDYPMRKLLLGPLPARPGEEACRGPEAQDRRGGERRNERKRNSANCSRGIGSKRKFEHGCGKACGAWPVRPLHCAGDEGLHRGLSSGAISDSSYWSQLFQDQAFHSGYRCLDNDHLAPGCARGDEGAQRGPRQGAGLERRGAKSL